MATGSPCQSLPAEILIEIFRISTELPVTHPRFRRDSTLYTPFFNTIRLPYDEGYDNAVQELDKVWKVKMALPLVCKFWWKFSSCILYEEVHVGRHADSLLKGFQRSETLFPGNGFGRQVRHILFCSWRESEPVSILADILSWCPNVTYITKDDDDMTPALSLASDFSSIRRFNWVYTRHMAYNMGCNRMHGREFYRTIVRKASHLQYLYIAVTFPNHRLSIFPTLSITLKSLTTLHVEHVGTVLRAELEQWSFPNLKHLVTDGSLAVLTISPLFGPHLEIVEFLDDCDLHETGFVAMQQCPNLRELAYHVKFLSVSDRTPSLKWQKLETLRLSCVENCMLDEEEEVKSTIEGQVNMILDNCFPSLQRIIFYGDKEEWKEVCSLVDGFKDICENLLRRNCTLEDEHGNPFPAWTT